MDMRNRPRRNIHREKVNLGDWRPTVRRLAATSATPSASSSSRFS
nr:hypothetical protein [Lacticaseibacillus nasuensis]